MLVKGNIFHPKPTDRILLIQLGDIGDVVLTMPAIRTLRRHLPDSRLVLCVREHARELAQDCPWADGVISIDKRPRPLGRELVYQAGFLSQVRGPRFDVAIDLRTGTRGAIAALLSGARHRIGRFADQSPYWRNRIFTHLVRPQNEFHQYASAHHLNIIAPFGFRTDDILPFLYLPETRRRKARVILAKAGGPDTGPIIAIHPFSLWQYKEWQAGEWAVLIRHFIEIHGCSIIITGAPSERMRAQAMTRGIGKRVFNLAGRTSIGELPAILKRCDLFIGVDTAALHMAAAVGVPTVGIFGPSSPATWAPRGGRHCVVTKGMSCQPCREKGCQGTEKSRCLDELTAEEVALAVKTHLQGLTRDSKGGSISVWRRNQP
jgi:predicted lipopolysaccharide heptosyltransferase III